MRDPCSELQGDCLRVQASPASTRLGKVGGNVMDCLPDELEQRRDKAKEQIPRSSRACLLPVSINEDSY